MIQRQWHNPWTADSRPTSNSTRRIAKWNSGQYHRHDRRRLAWKQRRGWRRLAAEHEQSEVHHKDVGGRRATKRRSQRPPWRRTVRLVIVTINVISAATRAHIEANGLNTTGRMAELDYLFSETGLDLVGVQESRLPQTQILQTNGYTGFNAGASSGKHRYGVQLWVQKRHAKAAKKILKL